MEWIFAVIGVIVLLSLLGGKNEKGSDNTEFDEKNFHFNNFRQAQELLISGGSGKIPFQNEKQKLTYLHFMMGAIDQLSRTISDDKKSEEWFYLQSLAVGAGIYPANVIEQHLSSYGIPNGEYYDIGQKGWEAMKTYIMSSVNKVSEAEFQKSCLALSRVMRG